MNGEPFHVGCGERTTRELVTLRVERHAAIWPTPAVWALPKQLRFRCPVHGLVTWDQTTYDRRAAKAQRRAS